MALVIRRQPADVIDLPRYRGARRQIMWIDVMQIGLAREAERDITAGVCLDISIVTLAGSLKRSVRLWRTSASVAGSVQPGGTTLRRSQITAPAAKHSKVDTPIVTASRNTGRRRGRNKFASPCGRGSGRGGCAKFLDNHASRVCRPTNFPSPGLASTAVPSQTKTPRRYVAATRARIMPSMIRRPPHLRPILDCRLVEHELTPLQHAQIGIRPHTDRTLPRPEPMHPAHSAPRSTSPSASAAARAPSSSENINGAKLCIPVSPAPLANMSGSVLRSIGHGA